MELASSDGGRGDHRGSRDDQALVGAHRSGGPGPFATTVRSLRPMLLAQARRRHLGTGSETQDVIVGVFKPALTTIDRFGGNKQVSCLIEQDRLPRLRRPRLPAERSVPDAQSIRLADRPNGRPECGGRLLPPRGRRPAGHCPGEGRARIRAGTTLPGRVEGRGENVASVASGIRLLRHSGPRPAAGTGPGGTPWARTGREACRGPGDGA